MARPPGISFTGRNVPAFIPDARLAQPVAAITSAAAEVSMVSNSLVTTHKEKTTVRGS